MITYVPTVLWPLYPVVQVQEKKKAKHDPLTSRASLGSKNQNRNHSRSYIIVRHPIVSSGFLSDCGIESPRLLWKFDKGGGAVDGRRRRLRPCWSINRYCRFLSRNRRRGSSTIMLQFHRYNPTQQVLSGLSTAGRRPNGFLELS